MRILDDVKLDFCDVLIQPKRSKSPSRSNVCLNREFTFLNSGNYWKGFPVIASNMSVVGTFKMAKAISKFGATTALHKHYTYEELYDFFLTSEDQDVYDGGATWYTLGINKEDWGKLNRFKSVGLGNYLRHICLDVANGYTEFFVDKVKELRELFPNSIIMAGNVCTPDMTQELLLSGADIVKLGIGPGCFTPESLVRTKKGLKSIESVEIGEFVLTHRNRYKKVIGKITRNENKSLISVNNIKCTENHEFYVLNKKYKDLVNDNNIDEYAEWVPANKLNKDYLLLKIKHY